VRALVRRGSERKLPPGAEPVPGDALRMDSYTKEIPPAATFVHLIGTPHPSPAKAKQFLEIDLVSAQVTVQAACAARVGHFVYLSVAHPARMMQAFIEVRQKGEALLSATGLPTTFVRPWYVLGPGHWWPCAIVPAYWILRLIPSTRDSAHRLGLVTIAQMIRALVWAVENPPELLRILGVPEIRQMQKGTAGLKPPA